ncbi:hypothetical protein ACF0H5_014171 [Mactra antiquata]
MRNTTEELSVFINSTTGKMMNSAHTISKLGDEIPGPANGIHGEMNTTGDNVFGDNDSYFYYDYSQMNYFGEIKHVPAWEMTFKIILYSAIILMAIVGNLLIIIVVARNKRMQTTTNFYIVNLAVSDLLVTGCCTWVRLVDNLTEGWVLGTFFCKVNTFAQVTALVASVFSLILIACDRFFGIVFAMKAHIIERKASHSIVLIWICAIAVAAPLLFVRKTNSVEWKDHVEIWCDDDWEKTVHEVNGKSIHSFPNRKAYYVILSVALYFLPMVFMSAIYSLIIITVWFARSPGERISAKEIKLQKRVKRKVVKMLVIILATFGLCWMPLQVCVLYSELKSHGAQLPAWYDTVNFLSYTLAFANSALNPLIYAGFNENFRKGFCSLFGCYERKLYAAISRADSMYNTSTSNATNGTRLQITDPHSMRMSNCSSYSGVVNQTD